MNDVPMTIDDLDMSLAIAEVIPSSSEYIKNAADFIDWFYGAGSSTWDMSRIAYEVDVSSMDSIGDLSAKYESHGDPSAISNNPGDPGGKSYGIWQLASKKGSVDRFINWLKDRNYRFYTVLMNAKELDGGAFGSNFDDCWRNLGKEYKEHSCNEE